MAELSEADRFLLSAVERGDQAGWTQLVHRHQGRLLAFARRRCRDEAQAEDLVQETFIQFLRSLAQFRQQASLETWLFTILRRKIIDHYRGRREMAALHRFADDSGSDASQLAAQQATASWYARRQEASARQRAALAAALGEMIRQCQAQRTFLELKIVELIFFSQRRNRDAAGLLGVTENQVALTKHRWLKRLRDRVAEVLSPTPGTPAATPGAPGSSEKTSGGSGGGASGASGGGGGASGVSGGGGWEPGEDILTEVWEQYRFSCPKRSTIGAYLLGTLDESWQDYTQFHLEAQGCAFCAANLEDLKQQIDEPATDLLRDRILQSTVGFFAAGGS
jgi:RNA polymerase sigma factor (sigma-70 family)